MKKLFTFLILIILFSCSSDEEVNYDKQNEAEILTYLNDNNLTAQKTNSGLYYIISTEGTGDHPSSTSNVTVAYKGYFLDGAIFDQSTNATFNLSNLISGFREGTQLLKEEGSGTFILPANLGYGSQGSGSIPGGSVIIFDIDLTKIN